MAQKFGGGGAIPNTREGQLGGGKSGPLPGMGKFGMMMGQQPVGGYQRARSPIGELRKVPQQRQFPAPGNLPKPGVAQPMPWQQHGSQESMSLPDKHHLIQDLPIDMLCDCCKTQQCTVFCMCSGTKTFLCMDHISQHMSKNRMIHQILPIELLKNAAAPSFLEHFQKKSIAFTQGKAELLANLDLIEECCGKFTSAIEELIASLKQHKTSILGQLKAQKDTLKAEIEVAIREVQAGLTQESTVFTSQLAIALSQYQSGCLQLFRYRLDVDGFLQLIQKIAVFELRKPGRLQEQLEVPISGMSGGQPGMMKPNVSQQPAWQAPGGQGGFPRNQAAGNMQGAGQGGQYGGGMMKPNIPPMQVQG